MLYCRSSLFLTGLIMLYIPGNQASTTSNFCCVIMFFKEPNSRKMAGMLLLEGKHSKSSLGGHRPVFSQALSTWFLFSNLSFLWQRFLLLSVASSTDGLCTVLRQQLIYDVNRGKEGEKRGRKKRKDKVEELNLMYKRTFSFFFFTLLEKKMENVLS